MSKFAFHAAVLALSVLSSVMAGCAAKTVSAGSPATSPNVGAVVAAEAFAAGCDIAAVDVSSQVSAWLTGPCVTAADGFAAALEQNSPAAVLQSILATLTTAAQQVPSGANGFQYVSQGLTLAKTVINTYLLLTGQSATPVPVGASSFFGAPKPHKIKWTASEKARLAALRAKLAAKKAAHK